MKGVGLLPLNFFLKILRHILSKGHSKIHIIAKNYSGGSPLDSQIWKRLIFLLTVLK